MTIKNRKTLNLIILIVAFIVIMPTQVFGATTTSQSKSLIEIVRDFVAQWYFVFRYFSIALMLLVLIYLGIRAAISSVAEDKARYKRMLVDWVIGFIIIFTIHYFMLLILKLNDICVDTIKIVSSSLGDKALTAEEKALGISASSAGLYETIRTRAYELRFSIGTSGMIIYMVLVYYTIKFLFIYFRRFFTILILTVMAPLMGLAYAFNKITSGKEVTLKKWAEEYTFNVFLQTIHALIYGVFVQLALVLSDDSLAGLIIALVMMNFMSKAEKIFRKIFKFSGDIASENSDTGIKENMAALTAIKSSVGALFGAEMVKDAAGSVKRGIGVLTNAGMLAGLSGYNQVLLKGDKNLDGKKEELLQVKKQELKEKDKEENADKEKLKELKEKRENLENKIGRMEKRRKNIEKYRGGIQDEEKLQHIIDAKTKGIEDTETKQNVEREIRTANKKKILHRTVETNKRTGQKQVTDGIAVKLKSELNKAVWGNNAIKGATKDLIKETGSQIAGRAMIFAGIPMLVMEPAAGLALLSKGIKKVNSNNEYKRITTFGARARITKNHIKSRKNYKKQKKLIKKANKQRGKYKFNRFNPKSLDTIRAELRLDKKVNFARNLNTLTLGNSVLTLPLKLTGTFGGIKAIQTKAYKMEEARRDYNEKIDTYVTLEKKASINKDFTSLYDLRVDVIRDDIKGRKLSEIIDKYNEATGKTFQIGEKQFQFGKNMDNNLEQTEILDNAILSVAVKNKVLDLSDLNLESKKIQKDLVSSLTKVGIINENIDEEKLKEKLIEVADRINIMHNTNPNAVEEKMTKDAIILYMSKNEIDNEEELKKEEHKEKIKNEILNVLEEQDRQQKNKELTPKNKFEEQILKQEKERKKSNRTQYLENLINSVEEAKDVGNLNIQADISAEIERQVNVEKVQSIDKQLTGFEKLLNSIVYEKNMEDYDVKMQEYNEAIDEYIENNVSSANEELVAHLLSMKELDMMGVELKFKKDGSEAKRLKQIDEERFNNTYNKRITSKKGN